MKIISSEPKYYLGRSGNGLITSLGIKTNLWSKMNKKVSYAITNISMKDLSKIIKEIKKLPYKRYVWKRPKHDPIYRYFYLARQIVKCIMISDALNSHSDPIKTELTGTIQILILHVCDSY